MNIDQNKKNMLTAFHEAGHAVVALIVGRDVHRVSILPNQTRLGACQLKKKRLKPSADPLEDEILILLAGVAAEGRLTGTYDWQGGALDLRFAQQLIATRARNERQCDRLERRMMNKVEYLLDDETHWKAVDLIAKELLLKQTISGRAAKYLFERELAKRN